ncbi:Uncharacterised protein [Escherichia coli]|nr:hypothetical protein RX24_00480 [Escherichia coli]DAN34112.1 MAG TPA: protein of unknown function (DUF5320) [Bacteriophage sp.]CAD5616017.1 Uncharacterised protein [Escherichia coli]CAD6046262.1 Uncharacterised protein [Escherichia coli]SQP35924.1 Uncharacterised protein [Escherichia coli]
MSELEQLKDELALLKKELKSHQVILSALVGRMSYEEKSDLSKHVAKAKSELYPGDDFSLGIFNKLLLVTDYKPIPRK